MMEFRLIEASLLHRNSFALPGSRILLGLVLIATFVLAFPATSTVAQTTVTVELRSYPLYAGSTQLRIGDVAQVRGGAQSIRQKIEALDLTLFSENETLTQVTSQQLFYRIRLAKIPEQQFQVLGPERQSLRLVSHQELMQPMVERLQYALARHWNIAEASLQFAIEPRHLQQVVAKLCHPDQCQWSLRYPDVAPTDWSPLELQLITPDQQTLLLHLPYRFSKPSDVAVQTVQYQTPLTGDHSEVPAAVSAVSPQPIPQMIPSQPLQQTALPAVPAKDANVISRNQLVTLLVDTGSVSLKLRNGRALQAGAVGDVIEVRNPRNPSAKLFGRIVDSHTVRIEN